MKSRIILTKVMAVLTVLSFLSCTYPSEIENGDDDTTGPESEVKDPNPYSSQIPIDFSMAGYRYGNADFPDYPVMTILAPPADGPDATAMIQNALDHVQTPGAVLLQAGTYNVSGNLRITRSGVVIRGEGTNTVIVAKGKTQRTLMALGKETNRISEEMSDIKDEVTHAGQMWVRAKYPSLFRKGDRITINFRPNSRWISDLKMDQIAQNSSGSVVQWTPDAFSMSWEREVTAIEGDKVWLDAPVVMELDGKYARDLYIQKVRTARISESGIENVKMVSEYAGPEDEEHAWTAIGVNAAEHCWVRGVVTAHFGYALVDLKKGARNITVRDCISTEPVSVITGSRRYAFCISGGELCLIERCRAEEDRHGFITGARVPGPNVFLDCVMVNAHSSMGPHHRWASGILFDNCTTDSVLEIQDRAGYGTGHGWSGVNIVYWNCTGEKIVCQSPWVNGKNWAVGCIGKKYSGRKYDDGIKRPDGEWLSHGSNVEPQSLYRYQKSLKQK